MDNIRRCEKCGKELIGEKERCDECGKELIGEKERCDEYEIDTEIRQIEKELKM